MDLVANSAGVVTGKFTIPAGIPAGTKLVSFNGSGGSSGQAMFTGQGTLVSTTLRQAQTVTSYGWDPLAQTFTLTEAGQVSSVDLMFSAKGTSQVVVQIRETANGVPTRTVLVEKRLKPSGITLNAPTNVAFPSPVALSAGIEYALVIMCDDAVTELYVGQLGKWDETSKKWVTSQPYQVGVLLSSSNASTWTPHQDLDLWFGIRLAGYGSTQRVVNLGTVAVSSATDLLLLAADETPSSDTRIVYELVLPDASVLSVADGQPVRLNAPISGSVTVRANLYGSAAYSPILFPGTQLVVGRVGTSGSYVSQAIKGGANVRLKVVFEALIPASSSIGVKYQGGDVGDSWLNVPLTGTTQGDDGWLEVTQEVSGVNEAMIRIKLDLAGTTGARPRVRNLRFMTI